MRKQLYLDIKNALKSIVDSEDNPVFKHFDLWNQQVEFLEEETPFERPAVFIELSPLAWNQVGLKKQEAELQVKIHIVTDWWAQTHDSSPVEDEMLAYLDIADVVVRKLNNFAASSGNTFMRIRSETNHNHERVVDSVEVFKCSVIDTSATATYTVVENVVPVVSVNPPEVVPEPVPED